MMLTFHERCNDRSDSNSAFNLMHIVFDSVTTRRIGV